MQHFKNDTPQKSLSLILSIIFHILIFLLFIYFQWDNITQKIVAPPDSQKALPEPESPPDSDVAALKTGASQFGAPVIFQEEPTLTPPDTQKAPESPDPDPQPEPEKQPESKQAAPQKTEIPEQRGTFIAEPQEPKQPISFKPAPEPAPTPQKTPEPQPIRQVEQKKPSFADLAKGFIQTLRDQGGHDMFERKGNENLRPDMEELKIISYQEKVIWFMQNSFRAHSNEEPGPLEPLLLCPTLLTLNQDGSIVELRLVQSSGSQTFDAFYLKVIRDAAPFPPVPSHIQTPFTFRFTGQHYSERRTAQGVKRKKPAGLSMR